ncbi:MAG: VOC family protein [Actinomycetota bacterium]|nr:VOC family protein [Actinomycetota bacterium]
MRVENIIADLHVEDIESAKDFYMGFLGLQEEGLGLDWVTRLRSPQTGAVVQLVSRDATAPEDPVVSVLVDDVDAAYDIALRGGYEIVHALRVEAWGVRRFFVRAPDGNVVNVVGHRA